MPRRTIEPQQERSSETRRRILTAAIDCLTTLGYSATTTTVVGERAGVSRGALLYHFPTRQQLVSAAVAELFDTMRQQYETAFARLAPRRARIAAAIDLLWQTFQDPRLTVVLELWLAARTDGELQRQLLPVSLEHQRHIRSLARRFFPSRASDQRFERVLALIIDTLQGAAVRRLSQPDDPSIEQTIDFAKEIAASAMAGDEG